MAGLAADRQRLDVPERGERMPAPKQSSPPQGGKTALVIGVQSQDANMQTSKGTPNMPPRMARCDRLPAASGVSDEKALLTYYQQVGKMTDLPLVMQTQDQMSVDLVRPGVQNHSQLRAPSRTKAAAGGGPSAAVTEILRLTNTR